MKKFLIHVAAVAVLGIAVTPLCAAETHESLHARADAQKIYAVSGEVVSINKNASKIRIRHKAAPELGWSAATMSFGVADKSRLENLKVGDMVNFEITKDHLTGRFVIQTLQKVK